MTFSDQSSVADAANILAAPRILLLAGGPHERRPQRGVLRSEVWTHFPASFLGVHPDVSGLCDGEAARGVVPDSFNHPTPVAYAKSESPA